MRSGTKPVTVDDLLADYEAKVKAAKAAAESTKRHGKNEGEEADEDPETKERNQIKNYQAQSAKYEEEHNNITRAVRRAQHEFEMALIELKAAEDRRTAAEAVQDRVAKEFVFPVS